ncbi:MAG: maltokinase N-terminal cap-like domain-containing protein [Marmoricola sp.]
MTREADARETGLHAYIEGARWFGGKGRGFGIEAVRVLPHGIHLVDIAYDDGGTDCYQLPLSSYDEPQDRISHALVGVWDGRHHYDAVHDRDAMAGWLRTFDGAVDGPVGDDVVFHRVPGHDLDLDATSSLFSGEQSNSSVAFGEDSLMKVFRRVTPGVNPDIEIHRVLTEAGSEHVAQLFGWIDTVATAPDRPGAGEEPLQLAMLQQFLRTATEGWGFALTSVRNLFAEADLHPEEVGGDFAGESHRLGVAVAEVHAVLREHFPTGTLDVTRTAAGMTERLDATLAIAPDLAALAEPARAAYERLAELPAGALSQRIHGDLHLGQTLRSSRGWKLVDFEGEPAKPLAERKLPDSPWRDVAGMLRSLDYAARTILKDLEVDDDTRAQLTYRADEWVQRNRAAFLEGYAAVAHGDPEQPELTADEQVLVAAYELDKAVYEVGYELRNRPDWVDIPMSALARAADHQGR